MPRRNIIRSLAGRIVYKASGTGDGHPGHSRSSFYDYRKLGPGEWALYDEHRLITICTAMNHRRLR